VRAVTIAEPGGPEVLRWTEVPDPEPGPGEVVVDVVATAVNRADLMQRQGLYPPPAGAPPYPGLECSGRISAIGPDTAGPFQVGDEVCALLGGGGYAERVAVPVAQLLPVPDAMPLTEAGALPEVACTVWDNLVRQARLRAGETVLIHGGGSGIGTFAIQFAKALGATIVTTARDTKHERLRELGADRCIDYMAEDFSGAKADVILDIMGAAYLAGNLKALNPDGRLVVIGLQGGRKAELDLGVLLAKRASVIGTTLRARTPEQKAAIVRGVRDDVWPLIERGLVRPIVDRTFPLPEAAQAHRLVESSTHFGKVSLVNPSAA
jgi:putative PIG3 family NAD(P)H quinone oxidoreductase